MSMQILDHKTVAKVWATEPEVFVVPEFLSRKVVQVLADEMAEPHLCLAVINGEKRYWMLLIKDLAALVGEGVTPRMVGQVVGKMGMRTLRKSNGYRFFWNQAQLDLIRAALEV